MIKLFMRIRFLSSNYRLQDYTREDYSTMCGLLREKYLLNNEEVQTSGLVKLLDDSNKIIGVYTASEARKKARTLINLKSSPIVCRASDFRGRIVNKFYQQVVLKRHQQLLSKVSSVKSLRVSPNLNQNELALKLKQIVQLSVKNMKVRVVMQVKDVNKEECLSKLEWIKSQLLNKCYIEEEISSKRFEQEEEEEEEDKTKKRPQISTFSFVVRSRESNLAKKTQEQKEMQPDTAIKTFLRQYYQQDDGDMMDLKSAGLFQVDHGLADESVEQLKISRVQQVEQNQVETDILRQAQARILNKRLKTLLSFYQ